VTWQEKTVTFSPSVDNSPAVQKEAPTATETSESLRKLEVRKFIEVKKLVKCQHLVSLFLYNIIYAFAVAMYNLQVMIAWLQYINGEE
jgi:hypothetical protein